MFTPYRANRTISAVVRTAKCAICGRFASFPKNALRRVESACQGFQLATERFVFAFQLVDTPSLLFDDDKRRLAVKAAARAERCRRHGDGSRIGRIAAQFIVDRAEGRPVEQPIVDIGFEIIERTSC